MIAFVFCFVLFWGEAARRGGMFSFINCSYPKVESRFIYFTLLLNVCGMNE
jgi:hypothetical protein